MRPPSLVRDEHTDASQSTSSRVKSTIDYLGPQVSRSRWRLWTLATPGSTTRLRSASGTRRALSKVGPFDLRAWKGR